MNDVEGGFASALTKCPCNYVYSGTKALYMAALFGSKVFQRPYPNRFFLEPRQGRPLSLPAKLGNRNPRADPTKPFYLPGLDRRTLSP